MQVCMGDDLRATSPTYVFKLAQQESALLSFNSEFEVALQCFNGDRTKMASPLVASSIANLFPYVWAHLHFLSCKHTVFILQLLVSCMKWVAGLTALSIWTLYSPGKCPFLWRTYFYSVSCISSLKVFIGTVYKGDSNLWFQTTRGWGLKSPQGKNETRKSKLTNF